MQSFSAQRCKESNQQNQSDDADEGREKKIKLVIRNSQWKERVVNKDKEPVHSGAVEDAYRDDPFKKKSKNSVNHQKRDAFLLEKGFAFLQKTKRGIRLNVQNVDLIGGSRVKPVKPKSVKYGGDDGCQTVCRKLGKVSVKLCGADELGEKGVGDKG